LESRPDLVTGTVFKTVVGAPHAPGRVRFPCGSAILLFAGLTAAPAAASPQPDAAMDRVAHALATHTCVSGTLALPPVRDLMRAQGHHDAQVARCAALSPDAQHAQARVDDCVTRHQTALDANRVGRARVRLGDQWCAAAVVVRRLATVEPVPLQASAFSQTALRANGVLGPARWFMMDPRGRVTELTDTPDGAGGHAAVAQFHGGEGQYTLQLMVDAGHGPEVAMQELVRVGQAVDHPLHHASQPALSTAQDVAAALRLLRSQWGLATLQHSAALTQAAQTRLATLQHTGTLQHLDAQQHGVTHAYQAIKGAPPLSRLAEVLAAGPTATDALEGLLASPAHRRHLQDPALTQLGLALGASGNGPDQLLVVTLGRPREAANGQDARLGVLLRLNEERKRHALAPLALDAGLQPLVDAHAQRLARVHKLLDTLEDGRTLSDAALAAAGGRHAGVQLYRVSALTELTAAPATLRPRSTRVGIGTASGDGVDGMYVVVVVLEP